MTYNNEQVKSAAQCITTLFAKTGNQSNVSQVVSFFSEADQKLKTEMDTALRSAAQNQKEAPTQSTRVLVENAASKIGELLVAASGTAETINKLQSKVVKALTPIKFPNDIQQSEYDNIIKQQLTKAASASHGAGYNQPKSQQTGSRPSK